MLRVTQSLGASSGPQLGLYAPKSLTIPAKVVCPRLLGFGYLASVRGELRCQAASFVSNLASASLFSMIPVSGAFFFVCVFNSLVFHYAFSLGNLRLAGG